ncbi:hypothetical protein B0H21DRAFT_824117 [Amylocystis lapponica]|nr:hypothetical protein B0H21DRAFT_824117 [Amylocystis lapponica]
MHGTPTPRGTPARRGRSPRVRANTPASSSLPPEFSSKATATFTSCLSIPVEGAHPIERPEPIAPVPPDSLPQGAALESRRAPRKSKTEALVALHNHAQSSLGHDDLGDPMNDDVAIRVQLHEGPPISVPSTLDMSSIKTPSPPNSSSGSRERLFGLTDCPTFHPTSEQFKDPLAYIRSISDASRTFGMCKIVPPLGWDMPFVTDTERFRFKTRLQRLNSIEASSRAKVNFLEQLYRFHKQQGNTRVSVPTINHKPLDLWLLRKEVQKLGGHEAVTKAKKWADLGRLLGYGGIPGLSTQIRNSYSRVILPYEHYRERVRNSSAMSPIKPRDPQLKTHINIQSAGTSSRLSNSADPTGEESPPSSPLTVTSSPLSEPPDEGDYRESNGVKVETSRPRRSTRHAVRKASGSHDSLPSALPEPLSRTADEHQAVTEPHCEICHKKNHGEEMLFDERNICTGFHMFCLDPPLTSVPRGQWFCHTCLFGTGGDFGFDEGEEHSLSSFKARDLEFRRLWFKSHPPFGEDEDEDASGAGPSSNGKAGLNDPTFWRLVQSPVETVEVEYGADVHSTTHGSGMPTLETHPLDPYSKDPWNLNNIPILSDSLLRYIKSDISGMTVPWTYVGMVFSTFCWHNEDHYTYSINYMHWGETKTWYSIPGESAARFEAAIRREAPDLFEAQPDLLFQLVTLMNPKRLKDAGVDVYACNQRAGEFVITFPKAYHAGFNHGFNFNEAVNFALPDWLPFGLDCVKRYQEHRKLPVFSHDELLITITQQSQTIQTAIWLNDSLREMTEREMGIRAKARELGMGEVLEESDRPEDQYQRFSDAELQEIQGKVSERAAVPTNWRDKLNKLLSESARPALRSLRALLAEGERIHYTLPELTSLRKCVQRANEWVEAANTFLVRKPSRKRARRSRGRTSGVDGGEDGSDKPERGLDDLRAVLQDVVNLGVRGLLLHGSSLNVLVEELVEVEKIVLREQLLKELDTEIYDDGLSVDELRQFRTRARLDSLLRAGETWEERAESVLAKSQRRLEDLDELLEVKDGVPVSSELYERLSASRARAEEYDRQAQAWITVEGDAARPKVQEVLKLVTRAEKEFNIPTIQDLNRTLEFAMDLETRCDAVLKNRYQHEEAVDIFSTMLQWQAYARRFLHMFSLPNFERLDRQLTAHAHWLQGLPWYTDPHDKAHGQAILDDVIECTRPEDDLPPNDEYFTCICNTPVRPPAAGAVSDAVQCDHCYARFHGVCAANGGSCPFCDHHHWNGTIRKERNWHFCYLPSVLMRAPEITKNYSEDWQQLEVIVHRVDRLSSVIGQFLSFASQPVNQRQEYIPQVRHYMRKLYKIQFAVSPNPEVSYGLDLAGLHRILAGQPAPVRVKKRRRPKFVFGQDIDKDWLDECELCSKLYHAGCVFYPIDPSSTVRGRFMCPLCCLRKNRQYHYSEVRVKHVDNPDLDVYVDTKEMLDTFSKDIIYMKMLPPYQPTLFVELIRFTPGQPDNIVSSGAAPRVPGPSNSNGAANGDSPRSEQWLRHPIRIAPLTRPILHLPQPCMKMAEHRVLLHISSSPASVV